MRDIALVELVLAVVIAALGLRAYFYKSVIFDLNKKVNDLEEDNVVKAAEVEHLKEQVANAEAKSPVKQETAAAVAAANQKAARIAKAALAKDNEALAKALNETFGD